MAAMTRQAHSRRTPLRLPGSSAGPKAPHHARAPRRRAARRKFLWLQAERKPKLALVHMPRVERKLEIARHHADHGIRLAVEKDRASQYVRIAVEAAAPHVITQHRHLLVFVIFALRERAPQKRWHS